MNGIEVTLHAQHLPASGIPCRLRFTDSVMLVEGAERLSVPVDALTVSVGGFHDDTLFINWLYNGTNYSAVIVDAAAQQALATVAPATLASQLTRGRGNLNYHRNKWNTVLATLAMLALIVVLGWWQSDVLTGWIARQIPIQREQRLGEALLAQLQSEGKFTQTGLAAETVQQLGDKLTQGSRYHYQWYVKQDASVNAFAIPGGIVVVNSGLITQAASPDELAGVLAHEVQHIELRHSLQQMIHSAGWAAILTVTLGDVSAITGIFIHQLGNLRHSRKLESEADREGVNAMVRAGIAPTGMAHFLKRLQAEQARTGSAVDISLLSTHPATSERLTEIDRLAGSISCQCKPLNYDWPAVQASIERVAQP